MEIFVREYWAGLLGGGIFLLLVATFSLFTGMGIKGTPSREENPRAHRFYIIVSALSGIVAIGLGIVASY
jgi:hypothetical protein